MDNPPYFQEWLFGGGEMGALIRSMDWSATPLGDRRDWPANLRVVANTVVATHFPMCLLWGSDLVMIYNDGYRVIAGERHPRAMGRPTHEIWPEVWEFNRPIYERVMSRGEAVSFEDQLYPITREGRVEQAYFTLCYSPVFQDSGTVGGTLVTLIETTRKIHGEEESRRRLREARRISRLGHWEWDLQTGHVAWSPEVYEMHGLSESSPALTSEALFECVHPEDRDKVSTAISHALSQGTSADLDYRIIRPDGSVRVIHAIGAVTEHDGEGRPLVMVGTNQDITDRRQQEASLRLHAEMLRLSFDAIILRRLDGAVEFWNRGAEELYGFTSDEALGCSSRDLLRSAPPIPLSQVDAILQETGSWEGELRQWTKGGQEVVVSARRQVVQGMDGVARVLETNRDITEQTRDEAALRRSESEFRALTENLHTAVALIDGHGGFSIVNGAFRRLFGIPDDEDILNVNSRDWSAWQVLDEEGRLLEVDEHPVRRAALTNTPVRNQLVAVRPPSSEHLSWLLVSAEPLVDAQGRLDRLIATYYDITQRKRAEERVRASLAEKDVLLKEIHHRVKNNMQVVSSLVNLQVDHVADARTRALLQEVAQRVRSMALVHESLYQSADLAQLDFGGYARSLLHSLWRAYGDAAAGIALTLELESVPVPVNAAVPCGLILNEVATNALKHAFAQTGIGEVVVSLRRNDDGMVCLRVRDNGVGIPPGLDWRRTSSLGFYLVQILAGQLSAIVELSSASGTEFTMTFDGANQ